MCKGPFTPSDTDNAEMMLAILLSLKIMELLQNGLQPYSGATPLISMRTLWLVLILMLGVDTDAWCRWTLSVLVVDGSLL